MNTPDIFEQLASRARGESVPVESVAESVLVRIVSRRQRRRQVIPLSVFAAVSAVAAAVILVAVLYRSPRASSDPMMQLAAPVEDVRLW